jgi:hypothetical protein
MDERPAGFGLRGGFVILALHLAMVAALTNALVALAAALVMGFVGFYVMGDVLFIPEKKTSKR